MKRLDTRFINAVYKITNQDPPTSSVQGNIPEGSLWINKSTGGIFAAVKDSTQSNKIVWIKLNDTPDFIKLPDGSFALAGSATQWDNQYSIKVVPSAGIIEYSLGSVLAYDNIVPYANYKGKVWVKVAPQSKNSEIKLKFYPSESDNSDPNAIFILYDDFTDTNNWIMSNAHINYSILYVDGGNEIHGPTSRMTEYWDNKIIEWNMYSDNYDFDSGIIVNGKYFISDIGSGQHAICNGPCYPNGSQNAYSWNDYRITFKNNLAIFENLTRNIKVETNLAPQRTSIRFYCDSDTSDNPLRVDYICVREYYNEEDFEFERVDYDDHFEIKIRPRKNITRPVQVKLPVDAGKYVVKTISYAPGLSTIAFPPNKVTYIEFLAQFDHRVKLGSEADFYLHAYIPPDAQPGKVKFRLEYAALPVQIYSSESGFKSLNAAIQGVVRITRVFEIIPEMIGKHVLFAFDTKQTINSLSLIVTHRLTRLGDEQEDTFKHPLPILYAKWLTEVDTLGSRDKFIKY